jgi:hypothetical protein
MRNFVENLQWFGLTVALLVFNVTPHSAHPDKMRENAGSPARKRGLWLLSKKILDSSAERGLNLDYAL